MSEQACCDPILNDPTGAGASGPSAKSAHTFVLCCRVVFDLWKRWYRPMCAVTKHALNKVARQVGVEALNLAVFKVTVHALIKMGPLLGVEALKAWRRSLRVLVGLVLLRLLVVCHLMVISSLMLHLTTRLLPLFSSLCSQFSSSVVSSGVVGGASDSCWPKHWHTGCVGTKPLSTRSSDGGPQRIGLSGSASVLRGSSRDVGQ